MSYVEFLIMKLIFVRLFISLQNHTGFNNDAVATEEGGFVMNAFLTYLMKMIHVVRRSENHNDLA